MVIVRENCEGLYVREEFSEGEGKAVARRVMTRDGSRRVAKAAWQIACRRARRRTPPRAAITVVHKANVLSLTDGLFRQTARAALEESAQAHPEISLTVEERLVDAMAMLCVKAPERLDVLLAPNLYGDILSDLAAALVGGLGLAPSVNIGAGPPLAEPVHGSAPDIAGQGIANPLAAILSAGLLLEQWGLEAQARRLENAVAETLAAGILPPDLGGAASTRTLADAIVNRLR